MSETPASTCRNADCKFDTDQRCAEGISPDECPHRAGRPLLSGEPEAEDVVEDQDDVVAGPTKDMPKGRRLSAEQCGELLSNAPGRVIAVIAPRDSGKTSLIVGVYEQFLDRVPDSARFAGSQTLWDFERLCHLARAASGQHTPDMERTRRAEGLGFFHVAITANGDREPKHVLFADRPGEHWTSAADSIETASSYAELRAATAVAYLLDGEALFDDARQHTAANQAEMTLQSLKEAGAFSHRPALLLVLTKLDVGHAGGDPDKLKARFAECANKLEKRFKGDFAKTVRVMTAASPETEAAMERGFGLSEFFDACLAPLPMAQFAAPDLTPSREMLRFGLSEEAP